jgi:hypothetical protein
MATVIDCCTKECIGYAIADHMRAELVIDALRMAARNHSLEPGATFHTDRGSQYLSKSFAETMTYRGDMCVKIVCAAARAGALPPWLVGPLSPPLVGVTLRKGPDDIGRAMHPSSRSIVLVDRDPMRNDYESGRRQAA